MKEAELKKTTELVRSETGFKILQKADPKIVKILHRATFVSAYALDEFNEWARADIEGALYIIERSVHPKFRLIILNQMNPQNLVEDITASWELSSQKQFIFFRLPHNNNSETRRIAGLWFSDEKERRQVKEGLDEILLMQQSSENHVSKINEIKPSQSSTMYENCKNNSTKSVLKHYKESSFKNKFSDAYQDTNQKILSENLILGKNDDKLEVQTTPKQKHLFCKLLDIQPNIRLAQQVPDNLHSLNELINSRNKESIIPVSTIVSEQSKNPSGTAHLDFSKLNSENNFYDTDYFENKKHISNAINIKNRSPIHYMERHLHRISHQNQATEINMLNVQKNISDNLVLSAEIFYDAFLEIMKHRDIRELIIKRLLSKGFFPQNLSV